MVSDNHASVSDPAGAQSMIDDAINHFGGIRILVKMQVLRDQSFEKASMDDMKLILDAFNGLGLHDQGSLANHVISNTAASL